jgi:hypothetical protein
MEYHGKELSAHVGNEIELGIVIPTIRSWTLQVSQKQIELDIDVYDSTIKDLCGCTWVIMGISVRLMIIHQRGVSVMSRVYPNQD